MILTGVLGVLALSGLAACGTATTPTTQPQPTVTATVSQVQPVPTQASAVTDNALGDAPTPDMTMSDTSTPDMVMADTPAPVDDTAVPATSTPVPDNATPTTAQASSTQDTGSTSTGTTATETNVQATLIEWAIQLSQSEVPAGKVRFTVTNQGSMMHNLTIEDDNGVIAQTATFSPSQGAQTLEVDLTPGTYTLICSLPGHAQRGQKTTLVVK